MTGVQRPSARQARKTSPCVTLRVPMTTCLSCTSGFNARLKMRGLDPAGLEVAAIQLTRKIAVAAQEPFAAPDGFFKRKIFQTMQRIMVHERCASASIGR